MNERSRELVRQAGLDDADFPIEDWDNVPLARYTELIVRECAGVADHSNVTGKSIIGQRIKEHFGVEE